MSNPNNNQASNERQQIQNQAGFVSESNQVYARPQSTPLNPKKQLKVSNNAPAFVPKGNNVEMFLAGTDQGSTNKPNQSQVQQSTNNNLANNVQNSNTNVNTNNMNQQNNQQNNNNQQSNSFKPNNNYNQGGYKGGKLNTNYKSYQTQPMNQQYQPAPQNFYPQNFGVPNPQFNTFQQQGYQSPPFNPNTMGNQQYQKNNLPFQSTNNYQQQGGNDYQGNRNNNRNNQYNTNTNANTSNQYAPKDNVSVTSNSSTSTTNTTASTTNTTTSQPTTNTTGTTSGTTKPKKQLKLGTSAFNPTGTASTTNEFFGSTKTTQPADTTATNTAAAATKKKENNDWKDRAGKNESDKTKQSPQKQPSQSKTPVAEEQTAASKEGQAAPTMKADPQNNQSQAPPEQKREQVQKKPEETKVEQKQKTPETTTNEKAFTKPASEKKEVKLEIIINYKIEDLEKLINEIHERNEKKALPSHIEAIKNREISTEQQDTKFSRGNDKKKTQTQYNKQQSNVGQGSGSGFDRGSQAIRNPQERQQQQQQGGFIQRQEMTPEEIALKKKIAEQANRWTQGIVASDPEKQLKNAIKLNLNKLTPDNFEIIRDDILKIAVQGLDNTQKVADLIIENAWTQKHYVNTYAKLCEYLGKCDKLFFEEKKEGKKKNDFKLHIMKKIQNVFEDESNLTLTGLPNKNPEEMEPEDRSEYYRKKKQKIMGNVNFIGELFLEKFIVIGIVRIINRTLLQKFLEEYNSYQKAETKPHNKNHEDALEGLLRFIELTGKAIEDKESTKPPDAKKSKEQVDAFQDLLTIAHSNIPDDEKFPQLGNDEISLEDLFNILELINNQAALTNRLASLVKNLQHRKNNKWSAPLYKNQGPKKIQEIYDDYEKEQEESERRAQELYEEERAQQKRGGGSYNQSAKQQQEVQFQVSYTAKPKKDEESKMDFSNVKVDTSDMDFKAQRGKKTGDKGGIKKAAYGIEEVEREFKEIYKLIDESSIEEQQEGIAKRAEGFKGKASGQQIAHAFLKSFYDATIEKAQRRVLLIPYMEEEKFFNKEDFAKAASAVLNKLWETSCDFPECEDTVSRVLLETFNTNLGFEFNDIAIPADAATSEEGEFILDFHKEVLGAVIKNIYEADGAYSDLKDVVKVDDLQAYAKKIGYEEEIKKPN